MGYDAPPFLAILVDTEAVYFESRIAPPLKDLQEIAESFDVDLKLLYILPDEHKREKFNYTCLKNRKLEGLASDLKKQIFKAVSVQELEKASVSINEKGHGSHINMNEWTILAYLAEKKYNELAIAHKQVDEDRKSVV